MTTDEAKQIWSEITSAWMKLPKDQRGTGSKKALAEGLWARRFRDVPYQEWYAELIAKAMVRTSMSMSKSKGDSTNVPYIERYRQLALKRDNLPDDDLLCDLWGCARDGTLASARSRLKDQGFDFDLQPDKQFKVIKRPRPPVLITAKHRQAVDTLLDPEPPTKTPGQIAIEQQTDVMRQEFARLNICINELAQIMADVAQSLQKQSEILLRLAEAWGK